MNSYKKLVVFGDGLSDQGRFGVLTQGAYPPSPPFLEGRWTNGPTWVEHLSARTGIPLAAEDNYAQGGATTGWYNINEPMREALGLDASAPIRGVAAQIEAFLSTTPKVDPETLFVLWAGGHDIGAYVQYGQPDLLSRPAAENIHEAIERLAQAGARHIFLGNMPDLADTPQYNGTPEAEIVAQLVAVYNAGLLRVADTLRRRDELNIIEFDGAAAFKEIAHRAKEYGLEHIDEAFLPMDYINFQDPLASPKPLPPEKIGQDPLAYFSFWAVSAGAKVHEHLAIRAIALLELNEVWSD